MSNLLLITDVARLQNVFGRLIEDESIRLRVVSSLEMGGEEIAIEKPDVVFVQTHLSGISADILLMHLKKQLGRKRTRFVLLASHGQTNETTLKAFQGWLDTSVDDEQLFTELLQLIATLLNKQKKNEESPQPESMPASEETPQPVSNAESSALLGRSPVSEVEVPLQEDTRLQFPVAPTTAEPSLEELGITYTPRPRLTVYSEFNSSFDSAVSSTPEPESLEQAAVAPSREWRDEEIDIVDATPSHSKKSTFLIWLVPVVIVVVVVTFLQQQKMSLAPESPPAKIAAPPEVKPAAAAPPAVSAPVTVAALPEPFKAPVAPAVTAAPSVTPAPVQKQKRTNESAAPHSPAALKAASAAAPSQRLTILPEFIPLHGLDKQYGTANPGWDRYESKGTEFKVFREAKTIKAIQVIDRGGAGVQESFMRKILHQVTPAPVLTVESSEKKDGFEIQRGHISDAIKTICYRDEQGGKLRAFLLTWK